MKYLVFSILLFTSCSTILVKKDNMQVEDYQILLTFDDGPNLRNNTTLNLLSVLKKYNVKAAFCLVGKEIEKAPELTRLIYDEGHLIVNHSYSHSIPLTERMLEEEVFKFNEALIKAIGKSYVKVKFFRPPVGIVPFFMESKLKKMKMELFKVSIFEFDTEYSPKNYHHLFKNIIKSVEKNRSGVIVLHDNLQGYYATESDYTNMTKNVNRSFIPKLTEEIIVYFLERGYNFIEP